MPVDLRALVVARDAIEGAIIERLKREIAAGSYPLNAARNAIRSEKRMYRALETLRDIALGEDGRPMKASEL